MPRKTRSTTLDLAPGLALPLQAVTETFAILAKRRSGKSNTAVVMAETLYDHGLPWVAIDPKGDWWGIRASGDGDSPGLSVTVFGGRHGDLPLEPTSGALVADLVVDERITCVLDVSEMDDPDRMRFLLDFAKRLYARNSEPLHLFCEEADDYIPQVAKGDEMAVVRAFTRLVKQGGFRGIGVTLITQRSAMLHKNVLSQTEGMIAMRTTAPADRKVIAEWVAHNDDRADIAAELPRLGNGEAWVIASHLLGAPAKVHFRRRRTFDSGATPEVGATARTPARLADVDLDRIKTAMAETIERAEADDPARLRRTIRDLQRDLAAAQQVTPVEQAEPVEVTVEVPMLTSEQETLLEEATERVREYAANAAHRAELAVTEIGTQVGVIAGLVEDLRKVVSSTPTPHGPARTTRPTRHTPAKAAPRRSAAPARPAATTPAVNGESRVSPARARLLAALVSLEAIGVASAPRNQVALFAGVSPKSSGFANNLGALHSAGLIAYPTRGQVQIADEGRAHVPDVPPAASTEDLHGRVEALLSPARWRIMEPLLDAYPDSLARDDLAEQIDVSAKSSGFANNLGALRSLGLLDYPSTGQVAASDLLFLD